MLRKESEREQKGREIKYYYWVYGYDKRGREGERERERVGRQKECCHSRTTPRGWEILDCLRGGERSV